MVIMYYKSAQRTLLTMECYKSTASTPAGTATNCGQMNLKFKNYWDFWLPSKVILLLQSSQRIKSVWVRLWHKMSEIGIEMSEILHQHIIHNNNNNSYNIITKYLIAIYLATALILAIVCFVVITCSLFGRF